MYHTKDCQSNRLLKERKPRVPLTTTPYSLPQLQFTNTKARGSHQVSLVPHGPSAPLNGKSIIIAAVSSTCTTQKIVSLTDFSKKENHGFPSPPHHTFCRNFSSPTQKHAAHIKFLWCLTVRQRRSTARVSSSPLFHQPVPHKRFSVQQTSQREKHGRVPLTTTTYSLPQLQFTNTEARGSHQVSLVPHGPSAPINGKRIITAAVSSTCTTQKFFSLTDFSKKENHGLPSPPHHTLCPKLQFTNTKAHGSHQVSLMPHGPSAPLNGKIIIIAATSCTTQKIFSLTDFSKKENHGFPSPPHRTLCPNFSSPTQKHAAHIKLLWCPHGPSAPIKGKNIIAAVSSTCTTQKTLNLTDFSKKEKHGRVPLTTTTYSLPQLQFTNTKARGSHQVSLVPHGPSAPINDKRIITAAVSSTCTTQKIFSLTDFSKKENHGFPSPPHHTLCPKLQFTNTKARRSHQVSLVPHGPSAPLNGKIIIIAATSCTTQKIFSLTDFSKKENHGFTSPPHHTLCPNFSSPTQKHAAHIKCLWCLTVRQRRSTAKISPPPLFHRRVPHKRFSVQQTSQRKKTTSSPHHHFILSAPTSVHQHKSTRLTSSFFGASRSVSAPQRQNYHHRRYIVYHTKNFQSNRLLKERKPRLHLTTTPYSLPQLQFTHTKARGSHQVSLVPHGPSAPLNGKNITTAATSCTTQKIFSLTDFSKTENHGFPSPQHITRCPNCSSPTQKHAAHIKCLWCLTVRQRRSTAKISPPPLFHRRVLQKIFSPTDFSKKENHGFTSPPHHTLCPNFSSPTQKHAAHIKCLWCLTVRQRRSTAKISPPPLFHRRVPHKRFSVQQTSQRKKTTSSPHHHFILSAPTSVHQHKSTRLTSSFFGASRSVSADQRQKYHHHRCFIDVNHTKDFQSNRLLKERKPRVLLATTPYSLPQLQFTNTKARGSHQVALVPHGPSAPIKGKNIIAAVSSTCTTQETLSLTDFSKKEKHGRVSLTTTTYSLPQLQFTNTKARGSHQVSLVPHGPSAPINDKRIITAAVSSTCTTQKILSNRLLKERKPRVPLTTTPYSLPQTSVHQHKSTPLTSSFFGASRSVSAPQRQNYHHRRYIVHHTKNFQSNRLLKERKPRLHLTTTPYSLPQLQFTHTKARGSHQVSLVPHGPSAPLNGKNITTAAVSSTCTTQKIFSPTDFSKKENHEFPSPPLHTLCPNFSSPTQKHAAHIKFLWCLTVRPRRSTAKVSSSPLFHRREPHKRFSAQQTSQRKKTTGSPRHHTILSAPTSVHQHQSTRLTSSFFGALRSVSADQRQNYHHRRCFIDVYHTKEFQCNRLLKERKKTTGSPHHHTILSAPTSVHQHKSTRLTSSFFGASRSVSADQRQNYHHRRCFIDAYNTKDFQSNRLLREKKKTTGSSHHHTLLAAPTSVHQHKSTRLTSSFFGASRSVSAERQKYHHRRCFINVYHTKDFQSNRLLKERKPPVPLTTTPYSLPQLQFTNTKAPGSHQVSLVPHGPSAPINGKSIIIAAVSSTCTTQKTLSPTDFSKKENHGFPSPSHHTLCPNFSPPTQEHAAHIKFLWCLTVRQRRSTAKLSSPPLFHRRVPHKRFSV